MADPEVTDPPPDPPDPDPPNASSEQIQQPSASRSMPVPIPAGISREGEALSLSPNSSTSTPPWIRWSRGLNSLLDDPQGRELFERYLEQEGCSAQLTFLYACDGLKITALQDPPKIPQLVRSIYRHFIQNLEHLWGLQEDTRSELAQAIVDGRFREIQIFDRAEAEVFAHMKENLYPNFLKSEIYLCAANGEEYSSSSISASGGGSGSSERRLSGGDTTGPMEGGGESSTNSANNKALPSASTSTSAGVMKDPIPFVGELSPAKVPSPPLSMSASLQATLLPNQLQTVHEDSELNMSPADVQPSSSKYKLTREALLATQISRAVIASTSGTSKPRKIEMAVGAGHFLTKHAGPPAPAPFPYHASYSSYNPVSRVDSEIQSLSSDAMTDDGSHHSGRRHGHRPQQQQPHSHNPHQQQPQRLQPDRRARMPINRDTLAHPELSCNTRKQVCLPPLDAILSTDPKQLAEVLIRRLEEIKLGMDINKRFEELHHTVRDDEEPFPKIEPKLVGARRPKPATNVLAAAINQLQQSSNQHDEAPADILDKHMNRVFADVTPSSRSPKLRSPTIGRRRGGPPIIHGFSQRVRRERDVSSTVSGDSGNIRDYPSDPNLSALPKSRSIPHELKMQQGGDSSSFGLGGMFRGHRRGGLSGHIDSRKVPFGMMKKTSSEFLDSGISVVSGATPTSMPAPCQQRQPPGLASSALADERVRNWMESFGEESVRFGISPPSQRRANNPELSSRLNPSLTLEEARRRLANSNNRALPLPPPALQSSVQMPSMLSPAGHSNSMKTPMPKHHSPPSSDESMSGKEFVHTVVLYDDSGPTPFAFKIPRMRGAIGSGVTLSKFKEKLPRKGHFRYFFKTECAELDGTIVQEEITEDIQELPLYQGRIFAHLQASAGVSSGLSTQLPRGMDK